VRDVAYASGYRLLLTFEDGSRRLVDLEQELDGEIFEPLKDINYFRTVRLDPDLDTIVWENGADISPDFLYEAGVPVADPAREGDMLRQFKIIVEKHSDGYVAYPLGLRGVVVGEGDTYEEALTDVKSAIKFHIETFGEEVLEGEPPVLEAFVAEAGVVV